jgi:4-alpha-glucanotransferase
VSKFQLVLLIHAHQPVGNFEDVLERAYAQSYLPFIELLERHPSIRMGLHYSGSLLEWFERTHPEFFARVRGLVGRGQVEVVGGGFYEPILISIPPEDRRAQIDLLSDYLEKKFGARPRGAWLTERVWEPDLPATLAPAGIEYSLVDDNHFHCAGFEPSQLFGAYVAEDLGFAIKLLPGLKDLRYLIPFRDPQEIIAYLRRAATEHPDGFAAMGDDCEKFGVWPKTYEHVHVNGWLERFYSALEANADWLETATPLQALSSRPPLGRADLPTASYSEMMEWALPTAARLRLQSLEREFQSRPDVQSFLHGGTWRGFFQKYSEANLLHKKMLHVSDKVARMARSRRDEKPFLRARSEAMKQLLRAQCNDAYWHGVFGGLYSPHLRTELWRALVRAETLADGYQHRKPAYHESERLDFDADGRDELYFISDRYAALLKPSDGATLAALDFRPACVALINSMTRRPEAYHTRLKELQGGGSGAEGVASIHERVRAKEEGLERWLCYDRWARHSFRVLLFAAGKNAEDYQNLRLDEDAALAGGEFQIHDAEASRAVLTSARANDAWHAEKVFSFSPVRDGFEVACEVALSHRGSAAISGQVGIEMVVNFLAPSAPDRYFESGGQRHPLRWSGSLAASELKVVDEWQRVATTIVAPAARDFWIAPIEAVSESEDGFERVYQGSQILAVWPLELAPGATWNGRLAFRVERSS